MCVYICIYIYIYITCNIHQALIERTLPREDAGDDLDEGPLQGRRIYIYIYI